ncbi:MAG: DUF4838 domain-containing protein [Clostridia bacterium]|nr:DUF4838 domain-containing protein [Clostridia bacterium]
MKKITALLISAVILLSALPFMAFAEGADSDTGKFTDVPDNSWFAEAVDWCLDNGYMNGTGDKVFSPDAKTTRSMLVTVLAAVAGIDTSDEKYRSSGFDDVPEGRWYTGAVSWAAQNDIVSGTDGKTFDPDGLVTREQLVLILKKYIESTGIDTSVRSEKPFEACGDKEAVSEWAVEAVKWAVENGIISGTGTVSGAPIISPGANATRAQIAVLLKAAFEKNLGGDTPVGSVTLGGVDISEFVIVYGKTAYTRNDDDIKEIPALINKALSGACGITLEVYKDTELAPVEGAHEILIGRTDREDAGLVTVDREGLGKNTLLYEMKDNYLIIASNEEIYGTFMAANKFIRDVLGVTYFGNELYGYSSIKSASLENGTRVVEDQDLNEYVALFHQGGDDYFFGSTYGEDTFMNYNHSLRLLACPGCSVSDDPSTYAHHLAHFAGKDPCLSSDENIDTIIRNVKTILNKNPKRITSFKYRLFVNATDIGYYCKCEKCMAQYRVWGHTSTYIHILSYICDAIKDEYPNVQLVTLAHFHTTVPPKLPEEISDADYEAYLAKYGNDKYVPSKDITVCGNAAVQMCTDSACSSHAMDDPDCAINAGYSARTEKWAKIFPHMFSGDYVNGYSPNCGYVYPTIYESWQNTHYFSKFDNFDGMSFRGNTDETPDFDDLKNYLAAILYRDRNMTWDEYSAEINNFLKSVYGPGWTYIREYIDLTERLSDKNCFWAYNGSNWDRIISRAQWTDNIEYARYLFDRAMELSETEEQRSKIEQHSIQVTYTECQLAYRKYEFTGLQSDLDAFSKISRHCYEQLDKFGFDLPENWYPTCDPNDWNIS